CYRPGGALDHPNGHIVLCLHRHLLHGGRLSRHHSGRKKLLAICPVHDLLSASRCWPDPACEGVSVASATRSITGEAASLLGRHVSHRTRLLQENRACRLDRCRDRSFFHECRRPFHRRRLVPALCLPLRAANLFRFFWLYRYCARPRALVWFPLARKFQLALSRNLDPRILAPLAYDLVALPA